MLYNVPAGFVLAGLAENDARVLRGGAFNNEIRNARCAYRNRNNPNNRNNNIGFRVVVASSHASLIEGVQAKACLPRPEMLFIHG